MGILTARVWKFDDNIDTDVIFPSQYMLLPTIDEMKVHVFEPLVPNFHREITRGDIVVAGEDFGCGSSREQAPAVLKAAGVGCVVARSFARIFFRNAINIGLPVVICDCHAEVSTGDVISVDLAAGSIRIAKSGVELPTAPFPEHITRMIEAGGLIEYLSRPKRQKHGRREHGHDTPMTMTEKILARAAGRDRVVAGEIIEAELDWIMTNDATTHVSVDIFHSKLRRDSVRHPDRVIWVVDHNVPAESVETANVQKKQREFAEQQGFHVHNGEGVCHQILAERYVSPGQVVIGADSHTCTHGALGAFATGVGSTDLVAALGEGTLWFKVPATQRFELRGALPPGVTTKDLVLQIVGDISARGATYRAMEYTGPGLDNLSLDSRLALANLAVEAGAKNAIMEPDDVLRAFLERTRGDAGLGQVVRSDPNADYERVYRYHLDRLEPVIAFPHTVDNVRSIGEAVGTRLDQVFIGSCSNGRLEDLHIAALALRGRKIARSIRLAISPASRQVYLAALAAGYIETFLEAGAMVLNPNCSTCWGGCQAVVGDGERLLSTGTRNFKGRSGSATAEVYLSSVFTAVASALAGEIVDPRRWFALA